VTTDWQLPSYFALHDRALVKHRTIPANIYAWGLVFVAGNRAS
jgi:hypothetical protein